MKEFNYLVMCRGELASGMNGTQLTMTLKAGQGSSWPTGKASATISEGDLTTDPTISELAGGETVEIISRSGDVFTLRARDINGNAVTTTHTSNKLVQMLITPADMLNIHARMSAIENMLARTIGNVVTGVKVTYPNYDELQVVQQGSPDMTVQVKAGAGMLNRVMSYLSADTNSATITAPSVNPRIDLVTINTLTDEVAITTGVESATPSAPATPSDHLALATLLLTTSHTQIVTGDITDVRVTL